jgi:superfamily II DNA helicase RecQ
MALRFFVVSVRQGAQAEGEVNAFLSSHRVLAIDRRFVDLGENSFWAVCIDFIPAGSGEGVSAFGKKGRIDYREALPPEEFAVFAKLRELRKQIAQAESVPVYTVFTNDQLAEMVRRRVGAKSDLEKVAGVGEARIAKYAEQFLAVLRASALTHETNRKPV